MRLGWLHATQPSRQFRRAVLGCVCKRLHPEQDHADVDHGEIVVATLLIASSDAPRLFEAVDQPLDFVAQPVGGPIEVALARLVLPGRDHRADVAPTHTCTGSWAAVAFIPSRRTWTQTRSTASRTADRSLVEHRLKGDPLIAFTAGQYHGDRPPVALSA